MQNYRTRRRRGIASSRCGEYARQYTVVWDSMLEKAAIMPGNALEGEVILPTTGSKQVRTLSNMTIPVWAIVARALSARQAAGAASPTGPTHGSMG